MFKLRYLMVLSVIYSLLISHACAPKKDTLFTEISQRRSHIEFKNILRESPEFNVLNYSYFYNGGGVAIGDVNNDRLPDIYFTGNLVSSHLYINEGNWQFNNQASSAGVEASGLWNTGVTMADVNGDGWLDIYVCRSAAKNPDSRRNLLFINNQKQQSPSFTESAASYGLDDPGYSTQAAFFDFDRDGDLDMYLVNHSVPEYSNFSNNLQQLKTRNNDAYSDKLYENIDGQFTDISTKAGLKKNVLGFGLGIAVGDLNNDGWPDLYVSNDFNEEDYLYINNQDGTFGEALRESMSYSSLFSMGSDAADINNDGSIDVLSLDMLPEDNYRIKLTSGADNYNKYQLLIQQGFHKQNMRNMLHVNRGDGTFTEVGQLAGVSNTDWSWSALIADYDLDGWQDLFVTNGYLRDYTNMDFLSFAVDMQVEGVDFQSEEQIEKVLERMPKIEIPNKIYHNSGLGYFSDSTINWGFDHPNMSNGAAYGDLDNDGDLDLVVNNVNAVASLYRNNAVEKQIGNYLKIRLDNEKGKLNTLGTSVSLYAGDQIQYRQLNISRGYQSASESVLYFGLSNQNKVDSLVVQWPMGDRELFDFVPINQVLILKKGTGIKLGKKESARPVIFSNETSIPIVQHEENVFNDFSKQALLSNHLSKGGPPMLATDVNADGNMDLIIGGSAGHLPQLLLASKSQNFKKNDNYFSSTEAIYEDVSLTTIDANGDEFPDLIIASGGNARPAGHEEYITRLYLNIGGKRFERSTSFPEIISNANIVLTGDIDGDKDKDIFLGGAYQAQRYPLPEENYLLINNGEGIFTKDDELPFKSRRTASAVIADIDVDGVNELIMAGEWEKVEVWNYQNQAWTLQMTSPHKGWYTSVAALNLDDDPNLEIVAGNYGLNSQFKCSPNTPIILFHGDFDQNGTIDPVLSSHIGDVLYPFVSRDDFVGQLPTLKKQFTSYDDYAKSTMWDILPLLPDAESDTIQELESIILNPNGTDLIPIKMPLEAQVAPIYAIESIDLDLDGDLDLILAGNSTYNRVKIGEIDTNYGLVLENEGDLKFSAIPFEETGINVRGDVRSIEKIQVSDKIYIFFGVNNALLKTYSIKRNLIQ